MTHENVMSGKNLKSSSNEKSAKTLESIQKSVGILPNIFKLMANSSNVLEGYLSFSSAIAKGTLSAQEREQIALATAGFNKCQYCASAHSLMAKKAGVSEEETKKNIHANSSISKTDSLIKFCISILQNKGHVSDQEISNIRGAGFSDEAIVEIVACVCANIFTNYFNHVAGTEIDFPKVSLD
jgi:uncharacterized peroxidase-related enzyme